MTRASWQDIAALADAIYAEAPGDGVRSMRAVGHTLYNRAQITGRPLADVAYARGQYSGLMPGDPNRQAVEAADLSDPAYAKAVDLAKQIASGQSIDPTDGATYYHTDAVSPDWADSPGFDEIKTIGSHRFYSAPEQEVAAVAGQDPVAMPARDERFVQEIDAAVGAPVDFETGAYVFGGQEPAPDIAGRSFTDYAGMVPADQRTAGQVDRLSPEGQQLLTQTERNLEHMAGLGYDAPPATVVTSGMRTRNTDQRTHPTGGAFDLRTRDLSPGELRTTAMAALGAGAQGLGVFDGSQDRFPTHMHVDNVGAWGPNSVLGSAVPPDVLEATRGAGVDATGKKIAEALSAGVVLPDGTLSTDFVQQGTIPREGPRPNPGEEQLVAELGAPSLPYADDGLANPFGQETQVAELDPSQRINQGFNEAAEGIAAGPLPGLMAAQAATIGAVPPPDSRMVPTEAMPAGIGQRVDDAFGVFPDEIQARVDQGWGVIPQDMPVAAAPQAGVLAAEAAPMPLPGPVEPPTAPAAPGAAPGPYDPLGSVQPPAPAPAPPIPTAAPPMPTPAPAVPSAPREVGPAPGMLAAETAPNELPPADAPLPREKPAPDTTMGNIIGQGFGMVGGGMVGGIPGVLAGRKVGGAIGRKMSELGMGSWIDDVTKPDPRMEAGIEAGWSSPGGDLNSDWDDKRFWQELSRNGYTNSERGIQMAMAREQRERAAAGQKTWADAFGINSETSAFEAGRDALKKGIDKITDPITRPIKENITGPIREAWDENVRDPIRENVTGPIRDAWDENVRQPIRGAVRSTVETVTSPIKAGLEGVGNLTKQAISTASSTLTQNLAPPTDPGKMEAEKTVNEAASKAKDEAKKSEASKSAANNSSGSSGSPNPSEKEPGGGSLTPPIEPPRPPEKPSPPSSGAPTASSPADLRRRRPRLMI